MTWTTGGCYRAPQPEEPLPEVAEVVLMPYLAEQYADLDALRDESGEVWADPDG